MKINSGQAPSTLIPEYIGSDFDKVIEVADNIEYVKDVAAGIEGLPVHGYIGETPPLQPLAGAEWYCTTDGRTYVWYKDDDSGQWVESSPQSTIETDPSIAHTVVTNTDNIFALWKRSAAEAGLNLVTGSFEEGGILTSSTDVLLHKESKGIYAWSGLFPHTVGVGTNPTAVTGYVPRTDVALRNELSGIDGYQLVPSVQIQAWKKTGDIRGWGCSTSPSAAPSENRIKLQQALDESFSVYVPDVDGNPFLIDRPLMPNNFQTIHGPGAIKNVTVMGLDTTDYRDSLVLVNKPIAGKVGTNLGNIGALGTRFPFVDYSAGQFYRLSCANAASFSVGEFVIIESTVLDGADNLPSKSFVTKISEVGAGYVSLETSHRLDIGASTIRSMSGYVLHEGITIKDVTLIGSYYVGDGQFGGIGGIEGFNISLINVKMRAGIGFSANLMNRYTIEGCDISAEYVGIEEALVSSDNTFRNNTVRQRAGFVGPAFGFSGNQSSAAIMCAEGAGGGIYSGNDITGDWYIPIYCKSITTPLAIEQNTISGDNYTSVYLFGGSSDTTLSRNSMVNTRSGGFSVMTEPGVKLRSRSNKLKSDSIGYVINRSYLDTVGDTVVSPLKVRLATNNISEQPSQFITGDDSAEIIKPYSYTSGATVDISSLAGGVLFSQPVQDGSVCQRGAEYDLDAKFNFTTSVSRTVTVNIGSTSASFTVTGQIVHVEAGIVTATDGGATGYGLGSVCITCDGVTQQDLLTTYPTPVWNGSGVSVIVSGGGQVSGRFFSSKFVNNKCRLP